MTGSQSAVFTGQHVWHPIPTSPAPGSIGVVALALALALSLAGVIAAVAALATATAAVRQGHVGSLGLATSRVFLNVEAHFRSDDHVLRAAVGQLREVDEDIAGTIGVLNESKALAIHESLQGSRVCHGWCKTGSVAR